MRRVLICTGVLGGGTALTFAAAALAVVLAGPGTLVPAGQPWMVRDAAARLDVFMPPGRAVVVDVAVGQEMVANGGPDLALPAPDGGDR